MQHDKRFIKKLNASWKSKTTFFSVLAQFNLRESSGLSLFSHLLAEFELNEKYIASSTSLALIILKIGSAKCI